VTDDRKTSDQPDLPEPAEERFPHLHQLFGGYLFQDWTRLYDSAELAIADAIVTCSIDRLRGALAELDELERLELSDAELGDVLLYELSCYYLDVERTQAQWLGDVAAQLREGLSTRHG
jgi:hypothetical protein